MRGRLLDEIHALAVPGGPGNFRVLRAFRVRADRVYGILGFRAYRVYGILGV